jgi:2-desacetyl-2-hydroxyethyl bacteriochlorophyllide A dehydrogenase
MKAIQIQEPPRFELVDLPDPRCASGQVIVRTAWCGLCGTDLEILRGGMRPGFARYPLVPGHEWTGVVEEIGPGVTECRAGDRVSVEGYLPCGHCEACRAGESNRCQAHEQIGMTHNGGFAEFVAAPARSCHLVPEHLGLDEALMVEPASTVVRAFERARVRPGARVAIVGCGPIGLIAARVAGLYDPTAVLGIDVAAGQESVAIRAGVTAFTTVNDARELRERSGGMGWDVVAHCAHGLRPLELAFAIVRSGGAVIVIGGAPDAQQFQIPAHDFVLRDLHVEGVLGYTTRSWVQTLNLLAEGKLKLGDLITHRKPLDQFADALRLVQSRAEPTGKVAVRLV